MTNPTPEHRVAFANGLAHLFLKYVTLTREEKVRVERVLDARTIEEMRAIWHSATLFVSATYVATYVAYVSTYVGSAAYACEQAIKAGVPAEQVRALRALTLGVSDD